MTPVRAYVGIISGKSTEITAYHQSVSETVRGKGAMLALTYERTEHRLIKHNLELKAIPGMSVSDGDHDLRFRGPTLPVLSNCMNEPCLATTQNHYGTRHPKHHPTKGQRVVKVFIFLQGLAVLPGQQEVLLKACAFADHVHF